MLKRFVYFLAFCACLSIGPFGWIALAAYFYAKDKDML